MEKRMTLWDSFTKRGLSRRTFLKTCTALTAAMGLPTSDYKKVVEAATKQPLPVVVWLHAMNAPVATKHSSAPSRRWLPIWF